MSVYETDFHVSYKEDHSPVTQADHLANDHIVTYLKHHYPQVAILSEESKDDLSRLSADWCWLVDPLDGTKEFIKKNGEFTVNLALVHKGEPVMGIIYVPALDDMYHAQKGEGAYWIPDFSCNPDHERGQRIHVTQKTKDLTLLHSRSHVYPRIKELVAMNQDKIKGILYAGSSLKGCLIARGEGDLYYRFGPTMEWDTAAMHCIIEEAGGIFRMMDDTPMIYNKPNVLNTKGFYLLNREENKLRLKNDLKE